MKGEAKPARNPAGGELAGFASLDAWLAALAGTSAFGPLLAAPAEEQLRRGYGYTLREISHQPLTWI